MSLSHSYQLKMVTDNFIQPKEQLILVDDLEWNYTKIIQENSGKSQGFAPYYFQDSFLKHLQHIHHRYGSHVPYRV
jgi:hypothetical protein